MSLLLAMTGRRVAADGLGGAGAEVLRGRLAGASGVTSA
jgi:hypothetical protein